MASICLKPTADRKGAVLEELQALMKAEQLLENGRGICLNHLLAQFTEKCLMYETKLSDAAPFYNNYSAICWWFVLGSL